MELHTDSKLGSEGGFSHGHPPGLCPSDMDQATRACLAQCRPEGPGTALCGETADIARIAAAMESAVGYGNFDIILVHPTRVCQPSTTPPVPCAVLYVVPMLVGC